MSTPSEHASNAAASQQPANARGAVDLSALGAHQGGQAGMSQQAAQQQAAQGPVLGQWSVDLDEAAFQDMVQASSRVPVLLAVTNERVPGGAQLRQDLVQAVDAQRGRLVLGFVDPDTQPRVAQALQIQEIPAVLAVLAGRPMPVFAGPADATAIAGVIQELLQVAVQQGMAGAVPPLNQGADEQAAAPSRFANAESLAGEQKFDEAASVYEAALRQNPGDDEAAVGLHRVRLLQRVAGMDAQLVRSNAAQNSDDVRAQTDVADLDVVGGHVEDGFRRLISYIASHFDDSREQARAHLVELFGVVGHQDPRVISARGKLANALF